MEKIRLSCYINPELADFVRQDARQNGRSDSKQVAYVLEQYAKEKGFLSTVDEPKLSLLKEILRNLEGKALKSLFCV